jgi:hypothetical protein
MDTKHISIAHAVLWRAILALTLPIGMYVYYLTKNDMNFINYVSHIADGRLSIVRQSAALLVWSCWYWLLLVPAWQALSNGGRLVVAADGTLVLPDGTALPLSGISGAWQENRITSYSIVIASKDGTQSRFSWIFLREKPELVVKRILEIAEASRNQGEAPALR